MKTLFVVFIASLAFNSNYKQPEKQAGNTFLQVEIENLPSSDGEVTILLFNNAKGFPVNPDLAYKINHVKISKNKAITIWKELPKGSYAISVFHDKNGNGEFDKSWFGSPNESYGFSNIPVEFCGTPSFSQTAFSLDNEPETIIIKLIKR
jgi:uncharacterized protein (DUF2141 family)